VSDGVDAPFLSIGEVLDVLKVEFPDVTISKIRFLESQGLVDPERTASGYRKFYDADVERLRWILRQQREHFLPLKVIKDRLQQDGTVAPLDAPAPPRHADEVEPAAAGPAPASASEEEGAGDGAPVVAAPAGGVADVLSSGVSAATFTRAELSRASGCDDVALAELERYGLLQARSAGQDEWFDEEALIVARLASSFARHGVEARHLRMYKTTAEREASFFEQVVLPMVKQRNPVARRQSIEALGDLVRLGEAMRGSLLRQALRRYTDVT
jgi:DNA-binding transcriptional MerR regulator